MAVQGFQSVKQIIGSVFRDLRLEDTAYVSDMIEWSGTALQLIGSISQLEKEVRIIKTSSHKAIIPPNLYVLQEIRYGYFNSSLKESDPPKLEDFTQTMPYEGDAIHPSLVDEYNTQKSVNAYSNETFFIKGGMIYTSFEEDWIAIAYKKAATDGDGYPKVPDHASFTQALYWFIVMKMLEGGFKHPAGNQINWAVAEDRWQHYCAQARTKALMPDEPRYREFAESWVSLIPQITTEADQIGSEEYETPSSLAGQAYQPVKEDN